MTKIDNFHGYYSWLSNFSPAQISLDGEAYPSVEHAYQAAKSNDIDVRKSIQQMPTAAQAKKVGKLVEIKKDWDLVKLDIMLGLLRQKFQNLELKQQLVDTGDAELIEGNWWGDVFWGVCNGIGENNLGKLLMKIRGEINVVYSGRTVEAGSNKESL
jgi:hypothetical protein